MDRWENAKVEEWIKESVGLRRAAYLYKLPANGDVKFCANNKAKLDPSVIPVVGYDELYPLVRIAEHRILQAGVRLAAQLNQIFK